MLFEVAPFILAYMVRAAPAPWDHSGGGHGHQSADPPAVTSAAAPIVAPSQNPAPVPSVIGEVSSLGGEQHVVNMVNNCGAGTQAVFLYKNNGNPQGSTTINGALKGGVAWVDGYEDCGSSGVHCGTVEFTLINPGDDSANTQSAINYSLQSQGDHQYKYAMDAAYTGLCTTGLGVCTSAENCPGAFTGTDTTSGTTQNCVEANVGIDITFC